MTSPEYSYTPDSIDDFEQLIQDAIAAVKTGNNALAIELFEKAAMINDADVRIWIWMSATTEDLEERRTYLEHAVALDPSNAIAKKGLSLVMEKLAQSAPKPESLPVEPVAESLPTKPVIETPQAKPEPKAQPVAAFAAVPVERAARKVFPCPNCGAAIIFGIHDTILVCPVCGFTRKVDDEVVRESKEQPSDAVSPAAPVQRWADSQSKIACEQCGVVILLPPEQTASSCPYCGSNRFTTPSGLQDMVDPQVIGTFKVDLTDAGNNIKTWLGKGWLAPDNLVAEHAGMLLHPAYYPFWLLEGTLEIPWFGDVNMGTGRHAQWEAHSGMYSENIKDVLIPGLRKLSPASLAGIEPFNFDELVEFSPDQLAGTAALIYDHPIADASLSAQVKIVRQVKNSIATRVEISHAKRNMSTGEGKWSNLSSKLALLPIYTGNYLFHGKRYQLLVNGQTGKVGGKKPVDNLKLAMVAVIGLILLVVLVVILIILGRAIAG
jgi:predicted RNA-binding Zn-ribbon protein involved in translation (DUF1610 family)